MYILSPSILAADFNQLGSQIKQLEKARVSWLHIDVMDGHFVPSISFGMPVIRSIRKESKLFFDTHLMVQEPIRFLSDFAEAGSDMLTVHVEACQDVNRTIEEIKSLGMQAGIALNPDTPIESVFPYLEAVNMILVMSVNPGFGGQKFISKALDKTKALVEELKRQGLERRIQMDGGIHLQNVAEVRKAGISVVVAGTAVMEGDIEANVAAFMKEST